MNSYSRAWPPSRSVRGYIVLEPVQVNYSRCRSQFESLVHFVSLVALVLVVYFSLLVPLGDTMLKVKNELCGGTQTFVVRYNDDTQIPYGF